MVDTLDVVPRTRSTERDRCGPDAEEDGQGPGMSSVEPGNKMSARKRGLVGVRVPHFQHRLSRKSEFSHLTPQNSDAATT